MQVQVLFFANLAELAGCRQLTLALQDLSLSGLMNALAARLPADLLEALGADNVRIARNQTIWDGRGALADGDEVAFLPPVTGG
jgi:molybdopterin converting factor subunit 1